MVTNAIHWPEVLRADNTSETPGMQEHLHGARVLIYSHDTFGLGHLRRCRAIAHSLVEHYKGLSVLILSGSPIIGSFDYRARVDFVRIPGVIKLHNGEYTSLGLHIDLEQTLEMRASIIQHTAQIFAPNLFLVDKEPLGLKGEVAPTLRAMRDQGATTVLGLRDVMDESSMLRREWERKDVMPALEELYDDIWVYGLEAISDPLAGLQTSKAVQDKITYTGYLPRSVPQASAAPTDMPVEEPYLLVTTGGGGDGVEMVDWVVSAYESDQTLTHRALIVLGPFMQPKAQQEFLDRVKHIEHVEAVSFDNRMEMLMERAAGVVAMGGYNTFCEILSFDKRALIIPRSKPRKEQLIRASRAQELGLAQMLEMDERRDPAVMAAALHNLLTQQLPSEVSAPGLLNGLININELAERAITRSSIPARPRAIASA